LNENKRYDFVYYPKIDHISNDFPIKKSGVFNRKENRGENYSKMIDIKFPDEDKWVKLEPVKFVKEISQKSKAALDIEQIDEYLSLF
jgi:hypothetical protein